MSDENKTYLLAYFTGCIVATALTFFNYALFRLLDWLTGASVFHANLKKLSPPPEKTSWGIWCFAWGLWFVSVLLSWICVFYLVWQMLAGVFRALRGLLQRAPEELKLLQYPLRHNRNMGREPVWAYVQAHNVKGAGHMPSVRELGDSLFEMHTYYPTFDMKRALKELERLDCVEAEVISE